MVKYIDQSEAITIDDELFSTFKFSVVQLMELAGQACANAIYKRYPLRYYPSIIIVCGPGNNGGDGLVCARHLKLFGYQPEVYYPRRNLAPHIYNLVTQCQAMDISIRENMPHFDQYDVAVDALFGFSYKPPMRAEFQPVIDGLCCTTTPICSIDVPSGWNVNYGRDQDIPYLKPHMLISLTAPKKCAMTFSGYHYLAGRFVPPQLAAVFELCLPEFPETETCVDITPAGYPFL